MIKATLHLFTDNIKELPIPKEHEVELQTLPKTGEHLSFEVLSYGVNPDTDTVEDRRIIVKAKIDSIFHRVTTSGEHHIEVMAGVYTILYDKFQPIPVSSHDIICKTAIGDMSVKAYLLELLYQLWDRGPEFFSTGSPFGYAEWQQEVYDALLESGHIKQTDGWREHKAFVLNMIRKNLWRN